MALIKFGAGISEMRGKEGGVIYSRNAYGSYIKSKVSPINPQTAHQLDQRTKMGNMAQTWAGLSSGQKASWDNLGQQVTRVNRFGDNTTYTGFSLFMKLNRNIVLVGGTAIDEAPTVPEVPVLALTSLAADVSDASMDLVWTPTPVTADYKMIYYFTNNILTGRRYVKNFYRFVGRTAPGATSPLDLYTDWFAYFGNLLVAGARIYCKCKLVHTLTGFEGVPDTVSCTVSA
jgi:hypothetical protein